MTDKQFRDKVQQVFYDHFHFPITYDMKNALDDMASILATALEEQRESYVRRVEELGKGASSIGYYTAIEAVIRLLTQEEENETNN